MKKIISYIAVLLGFPTNAYSQCYDCLAQIASDQNGIEKCDEVDLDATIEELGELSIEYHSTNVVRERAAIFQRGVFLIRQLRQCGYGDVIQAGKFVCQICMEDPR